MSEDLVEALQRQPEMMQSALTQVFVGNARVVASLGRKYDIVTQSCLLHRTIETPWGPVQFQSRATYSLGEAMWLSSGR